MPLIHGEAPKDYKPLAKDAYEIAASRAFDHYGETGSMDPLPVPRRFRTVANQWREGWHNGAQDAGDSAV